MSETKAPDPTGKPQDRRKLVAVVYTDMVGYSRLIGLDDSGTLERLRALRQNLIDPAIEEHGGRIVQTGGDSLLIVFDSIDGAMRFAITVQHGVPIHDRDQPPDRIVRFRIGINLGDAIADGTDLHGDAVNVVARLQAECPPGGICVTRSVRDHVHGRLGLEFEALGALSLKNIALPVEAYCLKVDVAEPPKSVERSVVVGTGEALPLPDKPSIAVLAFDNLSGDPEQEYFSDGISEDIIAELSRSRSMFVIARNSSFTYRGRPVHIRQVAHELGVRYVLEGSVRRSGNRVRVVAQLIDAESGNHIWAERYDRALEDVFTVQDEITDAVARAIRPVISQAERARAMRKPPENLNAWEAYQRGLWHVSHGGASDLQRARDFFERAGKLDPLFSSPHTMLALACMIGPVFGDIRTFRESMEFAETEARRATGLDPDDATALAILADIDCTHARYDTALERVEYALSVNPNDVWAYHVNGRILTFSGRPEKAREPLRTALRLSPRDPLNTFLLGILSASYYFSGDYTGTIDVARNALRDYPDYPPLHRWLAASLGQLGRTDEACKALRQAMTVSRESFDFFVRSRAPWFRPQDHDHMLDGLRKAGWKT